MNDMIQRNFSYHQQPGQVGEIARQSAPYNIDQGVAGVELKPGEGVYYVSGSDWIKPVSEATRELVTHVVGFNKNLLNTDIAAPSTNNISEVVFAVGVIMPLIELGSVFVIAGETVESKDAAIFNETTGKWIKYSPSSPTANDLRKKPFTFYVDPGKTVVDGGIVELRVPLLNFGFLVLGSISSETVKVSLTAAEIKVLRATPFELVAAQGANTLIQFVSAIFVLTAGSEVLTESADNMAIEYDGGSAVPVTGAIEATGFIDQDADTITNAIASADAIDALADVSNKNIALVNTGDGEYAGNASDDAALDVYITYKVLSLA